MNNRGECFHCGSREITWCGDETDEEGTVLHTCKCENCGATITTEIPGTFGAESSTAKKVINQRIERGDPEAAMYTENHGNCPECGWEMTECDFPHFCANCGTPIEW